MVISLMYEMDWFPNLLDLIYIHSWQRSHRGEAQFKIKKTWKVIGCIDPAGYSGGYSSTSECLKIFSAIFVSHQTDTPSLQHLFYS